MNRRSLLTALGAALAIPLGVVAQDHDHDDHRFYDKHHRDYHEWNDHEDRAWHMYWEERHHAVVDWNHASARERQRYWDWRHNHSDAVLKIDIR
jgi:hypothetical protein